MRWVAHLAIAHRVTAGFQRTLTAKLSYYMETLTALAEDDRAVYFLNERERLRDELEEQVRKIKKARRSQIRWAEPERSPVETMEHDRAGEWADDWAEGVGGVVDRLRTPNAALFEAPPVVDCVLGTDSGRPLIPAGKVNTIYGETGHGKTMVVLAAVRRTLIEGDKRILWWDLDNDETDIGTRLIDMGLREYVEDNDDFLLIQSHAQLGEVVALAEWVGDGIVVIETMGRHLCPPDGSDVTPWWTEHVDPFLPYKPTMILTDHISKNYRREGRARGGVGAGTKLNNINGTAYLIVCKKDNEGRPAQIKLHLEKDRTRAVRAKDGDVVATINYDYTDDDTTWTITDNGPRPDTDTGAGADTTRHTLDKIIETLDAAGGRIEGRRELEERIGKRIGKALELGIEEGKLRVETADDNKTKIYILIW